MEAPSEFDDEVQGGFACWCCGSEYPAAKIVRPGVGWPRSERGDGPSIAAPSGLRVAPAQNQSLPAL